MGRPDRRPRTPRHRGPVSDPSRRLLGERRYWWDLEFWNKSVDRSAGVPHQFEWTPNTFPKLALELRLHGRASVSPPGYVAQSVSDARFQITGTVVTNDRGLFLVKPERPWRADWSTTGLYDDGWTKPGAPARIRVFAYPGQGSGESRAR